MAGLCVLSVPRPRTNPCTGKGEKVGRRGAHGSAFKSKQSKQTKSDEIYVLGHSLAEVDLPYFERIAHDSLNAKWYASYKTDKDKENIENMRKVCGIDRIKLITLDDLSISC